MIRDIQQSTHTHIVVDDKNIGKEICEISASSQADLDAATAKIQEAVKAAREAPARPPILFSSSIPVSTK